MRFGTDSDGSKMQQNDNLKLKDKTNGKVLLRYATISTKPTSSILDEVRITFNLKLLHEHMYTRLGERIVQI
jgi:hypothetical protein